MVLSLLTLLDKNHHLPSLELRFANWNSVPTEQYCLLPIDTPPAPANHYSIFCLHGFDYSRDFIEGESHSLWPSLTQHKVFKVYPCSRTYHSCLRLQGILSNIHTIFCLYIHLLTNRRVISTFGLLWIMLWTQMYKYLFESLPLILLDTYPEAELLDQRIILCLTFWGLA